MADHPQQQQKKESRRKKFIAKIACAAGVKPKKDKHDRPGSAASTPAEIETPLSRTGSVSSTASAPVPAISRIPMVGRSASMWSRKSWRKTKEDVREGNRKNKEPMTSEPVTLPNDAGNLEESLQASKGKGKASLREESDEDETRPEAVDLPEFQVQSPPTAVATPIATPSAFDLANAAEGSSEPALSAIPTTEDDKAETDTTNPLSPGSPGFQIQSPPPAVTVPPFSPTAFIPLDSAPESSKTSGTDVLPAPSTPPPASQSTAEIPNIDDVLAIPSETDIVGSPTENPLSPASPGFHIQSPTPGVSIPPFSPTAFTLLNSAPTSPDAKETPEIEDLSIPSELRLSDPIPASLDTVEMSSIDKVMSIPSPIKADSAQANLEATEMPNIVDVISAPTIGISQITESGDIMPLSGKPEETSTPKDSQIQSPPPPPVDLAPFAPSVTVEPLKIEKVHGSVSRTNSPPVLQSPTEDENAIFEDAVSTAASMTPAPESEQIEYFDAVPAGTGFSDRELSPTAIPASPKSPSHSTLIMVRDSPHGELTMESKSDGVLIDQKALEHANRKLESSQQEAPVLPAAEGFGKGIQAAVEQENVNVLPVPVLHIEAPEASSASLPNMEKKWSRVYETMPDISEAEEGAPRPSDYSEDDSFVAEEDAYSQSIQYSDLVDSPASSTLDVVHKARQSTSEEWSLIDTADELPFDGDSLLNELESVIDCLGAVATISRSQSIRSLSSRSQSFRSRSRRSSRKTSSTDTQELSLSKYNSSVDPSVSTPEGSKQQENPGQSSSKEIVANQPEHSKRTSTSEIIAPDSVMQPEHTEKTVTPEIIVPENAEQQEHLGQSSSMGIVAPENPKQPENQGQTSSMEIIAPENVKQPEHPERTSTTVIPGFLPVPMPMVPVPSYQNTVPTLPTTSMLDVVSGAAPPIASTIGAAAGSFIREVFRGERNRDSDNKREPDTKAEARETPLAIQAMETPLAIEAPPNSDDESDDGGAKLSHEDVERAEPVTQNSPNRLENVLPGYDAGVGDVWEENDVVYPGAFPDEDAAEKKTEGDKAAILEEDDTAVDDGGAVLPSIIDDTPSDTEADKAVAGDVASPNESDQAATGIAPSNKEVDEAATENTSSDEKVDEAVIEHIPSDNTVETAGDASYNQTIDATVIEGVPASAGEGDKDVIDKEVVKAVNENTFDEKVHETVADFPSGKEVEDVVTENAASLNEADETAIGNAPSDEKAEEADTTYTPSNKQVEKAVSGDASPDKEIGTAPVDHFPASTKEVDELAMENVSTPGESDKDIIESVPSDEGLIGNIPTPKETEEDVSESAPFDKEVDNVVFEDASPEKEFEKVVTENTPSDTENDEDVIGNVPASPNEAHDIIENDPSTEKSEVDIASVSQPEPAVQQVSPTDADDAPTSESTKPTSEGTKNEESFTDSKNDKYPSAQVSTPAFGFFSPNVYGMPHIDTDYDKASVKPEESLEKVTEVTTPVEETQRECEENKSEQGEEEVSPGEMQSANEQSKSEESALPHETSRFISEPGSNFGFFSPNILPPPVVCQVRLGSTQDGDTAKESGERILPDYDAAHLPTSVGSTKPLDEPSESIIERERRPYGTPAVIGRKESISLPVEGARKRRPYSPSVSGEQEKLSTVHLDGKKERRPYGKYPADEQDDLPAMDLSGERERRPYGTPPAVEGELPTFDLSSERERRPYGTPSTILVQLENERERRPYGTSSKAGRGSAQSSIEDPLESAPLVNVDPNPEYPLWERARRPYIVTPPRGDQEERIRTGSEAMPQTHDNHTEERTGQDNAGQQSPSSSSGSDSDTSSQNDHSLFHLSSQTIVAASVAVGTAILVGKAINYAINCTRTQETSPLLRAITEGDSATTQTLLASSDCNVNEISTVSGDAALHIVVRANDLPTLFLLLRRTDLDTNLINCAAETALQIAVQDRNARVIAALLERDDLDVNLGTPSVLERVVRMGSGGEEILKDLLRRDDLDVNQGLVLHIAVKNGLVKMVKMLLAKEDLDVNRIDPEGATALGLAVCAGDLCILRAMVRRTDLDTRGWDLTGMDI